MQLFLFVYIPILLGETVVVFGILLITCVLRLTQRK